tara:strand:+ start:1880 stop:3223 length:1344 start_codon:yes stop_codon:yes gene_type:complete
MSDVYIVHCIDTEGPLNESLKDTFDRIKNIWDISLEPTDKNLQLLREKKIDLNGNEKAIAELVDPKLLNYNNSWDKISEMFYHISSKEFRNKFIDSYGNGWIYSWFCLDHIGYLENPRNRDLGFHKIFDRYCEFVKKTESNLDGIHYHYHPVPFSKKAHHCATSYFGFSDTLYQSLSRRIIDRLWFPCVYRPGFNVIRPDSHWFLEQYIPFDFSNQSYESTDGLHPDLSEGRFGDWRRAPLNWQPYHPSHEDYQTLGSCNRIIARCLNIGTRHRLLKQDHVDSAFLEASKNKPVVLSFTNHDYRDISKDIENVHDMIIKANKKFPNIKFIYSEARNAIRQSMKLNLSSMIKLDVKLNNNVLNIKSSKNTFGPQPFLAIKTNKEEYFHDNLDFQTPFREWTYTFDEQTLILDNVDSIGIGCCDNSGNVEVVVIESPGKINEKILRNNY